MSARGGAGGPSAAGGGDAAALTAAADSTRAGEAWGPEVYVHSEAEITGAVELGPGCCVCAAAKVEGGEGGLSVGRCVLIKEKASIKNTLPGKMTIGSFCVFDVASCVEDVKSVGDFVRLGCRARVSDCESVGDGSSISANCCVSGGAPSVGPLEVVYGSSLRAPDPSAITRQAQLLASDLPFLQRQLGAPTG